MQKKLEKEVKEKRAATEKLATDAKKAQEELKAAEKNKDKASNDLDDSVKAMQGKGAEVDEALRAMASGEVRETKPEEPKVEEVKEEKKDDT
jgi:hypothetical protein